MSERVFVWVFPFFCLLEEKKIHKKSREKIAPIDNIFNGIKVLWGIQHYFFVVFNF